jgi:hypothetical protein
MTYRKPRSGINLQYFFMQALSALNQVRISVVFLVDRQSQSRIRQQYTADMYLMLLRIKALGRLSSYSCDVGRQALFNPPVHQS